MAHRERCSNCQRSYNEDAGVVPADVVQDAICWKCYASSIADKTILTQREAEVYSLKQLDYTHKEIASIIQEREGSQTTPSKSTIDEVSRRISQRVEAAIITLDHMDIDHEDIDIDYKNMEIDYN